MKAKPSKVVEIMKIEPFKTSSIFTSLWSPSPQCALGWGGLSSFPKQIMPGFAGAIQQMETLLLSSCSGWCWFWGTEGRSGFCLQSVQNYWWVKLPSPFRHERGHEQREPFIDLFSCDWQFRVRCSGKKGKRTCTQDTIVIWCIFHEYLIREGCPRGISNLPERYLI